MSMLKSITGIYDPRAIAQEATRVVRAAYPGSVSGLGSGEVSAETVAGIALGAVALVLAVRGAMAYYVGKQFGRPKAAAAAGAIFGAPGVGAVALFGRGSK